MKFINGNKIDPTRVIIIAVIVLSLLIIAYAYWRSENYNIDRSHEYVKLYYIGGFLALFWAGIFFLEKHDRLKTLMVFTSILFGTYTIEIVLASVSYRPLERSVIAEQNGVSFDKRSKLQVYGDLIKAGENAVPLTQPSGLIVTNGIPNSPLIDGHNLFPLGTISDAEVVVSNETGKWMIFHSDRYGFNNPDDSLWDNKKIDILLVGDSFTQGVAMQDGEDIAGRIREKTNSSVINLGNSGNGPLLELATLMEYSDIVKPKSIFWIYYEGNDLYGGLRNELNSPLLRNYLLSEFSQNLKNKQEEIDRFLNGYVFEKHMKGVRRSQQKENFESNKLTLAFRIIKLFHLRSTIGFNNIGTRIDDIDVFYKIMSLAKNKAESYGGEMHFVYLPEYRRYNKNFVNHNEYKNKKEIIDLIKGMGIKVIDIHKDVFLKLDDPNTLFPFGINGHFNSKGYSLVADRIMSNL